MHTADEYRAMLRAALREEMKARRTWAVSALRETIAAIDNAESVSAVPPTALSSTVIAGAVAGLGNSEVPRRVLTPNDVAAIVAREMNERRAAASQYVALGRHEEAATLDAQATLLEKVMAPT